MTSIMTGYGYDHMLPIYLMYAAAGARLGTTRHGHPRLISFSDQSVRRGPGRREGLRLRPIAGGGIPILPYHLRLVDKKGDRY